MNSSFSTPLETDTVCLKLICTIVQYTYSYIYNMVRVYMYFKQRQAVLYIRK